MTADLQLGKFSGPLDLLLQLIDQEKMDITEVSLAQVTEQYFHYLERMDKGRSASLADFLIIATRLIYLKSRHLLPHLCLTDEESGPSLAEQLRMYKNYVDASHHIAVLWNEPRLSYGRVEPWRPRLEFAAPLNATAGNLRDVMVQIISRLRPIHPLPRLTIDHTVSLRQAVDKILGLLAMTGRLSFQQTLAGGRTAAIVNFLALLDLLKKKDIIVRQTVSFADLEVEQI